MSVDSTKPPFATPVTGQEYLRAKGLRRNFKMGESDIEVLKGIDICVRPGEFIAIEGRSGSGKSTLLHILGALDGTNAGRVEFDQQDYTRILQKPRGIIPFITGLWTKLAYWGCFAIGILIWIVCFWIPYRIIWDYQMTEIAKWFLISGGAIAFIHWSARLACFIDAYLRERPLGILRNKKFGFVFQFYHLLPELNVLENTLLGAMVEHSWMGFKSNQRELGERAEKLLKELGLEHRLKHKPNQLSGGERQRVAIARALMNNPRVLFADEPTGNLDAETGRQIMGVLERLHKERGQTIVMVTHDRALARQADRVLVLHDGRLGEVPVHPTKS